MNRNGFHQMQKPLRGAMIDPAHRLSQGLFAALLFTEGVGNTVYDYSGNGNHVVGVGAPTWTAGQHGIAGNLNASASQYYTNTTSNFPTTAVTIVVIANAQNVNASIFGNPAADGVGGGGLINIHYPYGGTLYWQFGSAGRIQYTPPTSFFGTWHHAAFTAASVGTGLYTDGVLQASGSGGTRSLVSPGFAVGLFNVYYYAGQIEQVLVYNRVLSASEIEWLSYENYAFMTPPAVRRFYSLPAGGSSGVSVSRGLSIGAGRLSIGV